LITEPSLQSRQENENEDSQFLILCSASVALSDDFKTIDGKEYKNTKVSRVEPDGIVLITDSGISKIDFTSQPPFLHHRLDEVRHAKDEVRRPLEQAQR